MSLKKVARTEQWMSGRKGARAGRVVIAYDATDDQYYIASGEPADAFLVLDATDDQWTVDATHGATEARIIQAGGAPGRIME